MMNMKKVTCPHCGQTLFFARTAELEIKCQRCRKIITVKMKEQSEPHDE